MKNMFRVNTKGQTMLFAFIFALLATILVTAISFLWQANVQTTYLSRDGMVAFYIAQAGLGRGRAQMRTFPNTTAGNTSGDAYTTPINGQFAVGYYNVTFDGTTTIKTINSGGRFGNSQRNITVQIQRVTYWSASKQVPNTWMEQ